MPDSQSRINAAPRVDGRKADELRPVQIEVRSLREAEHKLIEAELEYERQKGLTAGSDVLLVLDPAGNWVALVEAKAIM